MGIYFMKIVKKFEYMTAALKRSQHCQPSNPAKRYLIISAFIINAAKTGWLHKI